MPNAAVLLRRTLLRLERAEIRESNAHYRDDLRIARITVALTLREFCDRNSELPCWYIGSPYEAATRAVLALHPDQVWPKTVAHRKAKLGQSYSRFYGEDDCLKREDVREDIFAPKKPAQSEKSLPGARAA